ncbi:Alpha carbonic anhydrase domain [Dillenia turbinata]|uniref:Alpha carbonic anhydrase domain n=1 Tax=Dillenia turbinata TaxID=194707 RepID=A0AAN8VCH9_9MAGN
MKKNSIVQILFYGFLVSLVLKSCPVRSQESSEFSYDGNSDKGPQHWGDLKPEWSSCKTGTTQSAINFDDAQVKVNPGLQALNVAYKTSLAILTKKGTHNLMLEPQLQAIASGNEEIVVGPYNPANINIDTGSYYRCTGSLTTPPCTENVVWTVIKKVSTATEAQVNLLRLAILPEPVGNARPLQALNGREVELYQP